jgi:hypothetical protein
MMGPDEALKRHGFPWTVGEEQMTAEQFEDETVWPIVDGKGRMLGEVDSQEIAQFIVDAVNISLESVEAPSEEVERHMIHEKGVYVATCYAQLPVEEIERLLTGDPYVRSFDIRLKPDEHSNHWFQLTLVNEEFKDAYEAVDYLQSKVFPGASEDETSLGIDDYGAASASLAETLSYEPMREFSEDGDLGPASLTVVKEKP